MNKKRISSIFAKIAVGIPLVMIILILNITMKFLPFIKLSANTYYLPIYLCPVGVILAIVSLANGKSKLAYVGLMLNLILVMLELGFKLIGMKYLIH